MCTQLIRTKLISLLCEDVIMAWAGQEIKVGGKVKCINHISEVNPKFNLPPNSVYTVRSVSMFSVCILGAPCQVGYSRDRFIPFNNTMSEFLRALKNV